MVSTAAFEAVSLGPNPGEAGKIILTKKGVKMFTRTELYIKNRIDLLEHRQKENQRIVNKLRRQLKKFQKTGDNSEEA